MRRGGSRHGAGRPGWRRRCEHSLALDVRKLHRRGALALGASSSWHWTYDCEPCGNIGVTAWCDRVRLNYARTRDGKEQTYGYDIPLERTPCHFGGSRFWFRCPWCSRRCALVYGLSGDGYFGCRLCLRLGYACESESARDRLWRKLRKLEALLIGDGERPKRMRHRTFERIIARMDEADEALDAEFAASAARLLGVDLSLWQ